MLELPRNRGIQHALDKSVGIEATKVNRTYRKTRRLDAALFLPEEDHAEHEAEACLT